MNIDSILLTQRLYLDTHYESVASLFCNLAGAKTSETKRRFLLSSWYEGYLYTLLLGIKINHREERRGKSIDKAPSWSHNYLDQYKYAITKLLIKKDILNELNLLNRASIQKDFQNVETTLKDLKKICDEYSNGGLEYLKKLYEKDDTIFNEYRSLRVIYQEANESYSV